MPEFEWTTAISAAAGTLFALFSKEIVAAIIRRNQLTESIRNADVEEINQNIEIIRDMADDFWTKNADQLCEIDAVLHGRITAGLHITNLLYANLFSGESKRLCDVAHHRFMDAVGGGDFGDPDRLADPQRLARVHSTALSLRDVIRKERRRLPKRLFS